MWTPSWTGLALFASISCVKFFSLYFWSQRVFLEGDRLLTASRELVSILWHSRMKRSRMKRWRFSVYYRFVYSFLAHIDIMLTIRSAHCICFYGFKQDQLRSTIFNSITSYICSLLKAIYRVVFAFTCQHFCKIYTKLNRETLTFSSHLFRVCWMRWVVLA